MYGDMLFANIFTNTTDRRIISDAACIWIEYKRHLIVFKSAVSEGWKNVMWGERAGYTHKKHAQHWCVNTPKRCNVYTT